MPMNQLTLSSPVISHHETFSYLMHIIQSCFNLHMV